MAVNRIKIAKDKADLVKALVSSKETTGPFQTYADVLVFTAALGAKRKKRVVLGEISKRDPEPIPQEHFVTRGYNMLIKLLAMTENKDINILSSNDEYYDAQRTCIFEEYANGGLEILRDELRGAVDYSERLLLILSHDKLQETSGEGEFDLSRFLSY
ncbi:MAG: DNA phosphorothioation-associated protein 4 [Brasilonema angustatum HA4187-MV1]|jgi:dnd system-associated protein 4|nr:DNA phosphorothioation-associated protein 4 [Brasilonema angustatum HA4187-MV1]